MVLLCRSLFPLTISPDKFKGLRYDKDIIGDCQVWILIVISFNRRGMLNFISNEQIRLLLTPVLWRLGLAPTSKPTNCVRSGRALTRIMLSLRELIYQVVAAEDRRKPLSAL